MNFAMEVCVEIIKAENEHKGGIGKEVEIDEPKFHKQKYHRGKRVEGVWYLVENFHLAISLYV